PITSVIANLAIVAIVWFGGLFAQDGGIEQGQIIAMVNYMTQTLLALIVLANIIVILTKALASAKRVSEVLAQESSMPEPRQSAAEKPVRRALSLKACVSLIRTRARTPWRASAFPYSRARRWESSAARAAAKQLWCVC
ncbi:MAG: hypothetical protein ACLR7U_09630, partial [Ruthenibacterium lactatiformans]